jgi:hypothetical protein
LRYLIVDNPTGDFKAGKKHGQGTMKYANGHTYVGGWEDDVFHGRGDLKGGRPTGDWERLDRDRERLASTLAHRWL